ncbi:bacteriocin-protection, YdeI/OmpD-Associated family protein [Mycobacterium xenopi 4042]|uniref:Bacteriocin-protection, YdeI/OmpD-Associated family protein n=1 Tax=Mycobacterium xenopi 4042 TaxID=1299334 RepID=X8C777_MYCXE|nr:bacteriocin-protection, YdeI/OmpD-Associated family protein [Mycobacterium xenopi 4042]
MPTEFQTVNDADFLVSRLPAFARVPAERVVADALKAAERGRATVVPGGRTCEVSWRPPGSSRPAGLARRHADVQALAAAREVTLATVSEHLPGGVVHELPADLREALLGNSAALAAWNDITPLARNEFICWVEDAKQEKTRQRRIRRTQEELEEGQRRPCCWPGCKHRERTGR